MTRLVVLTPEELEELVASAVARALDEREGANGKHWLSAAEVAEYLGIAPKTVQNLTGPSVKDPIPSHALTPGGRKMFNCAEVDEWIRRRA
jgi:Helix-turn-helix domain